MCFEEPLASLSSPLPSPPSPLVRSLYLPLVVDSEVGRLCVVVTPGGEVIVSLTRAAVHLDLHTTNLQHHKHIIIMSAQ